MGRVFGFALLALVAALGVWIYLFLAAAGAFTTIAPKRAGDCRTITGVVGVEDLTIDPDSGVAYLAGYDRRADTPSSTARGAIWTYTSGDQPTDATADALPAGFSPHGISLWRGSDGRRVLFAINHANHRHSIEIFDVAGTTLTHRRTVTGPALVSPNDIVGVGPDAFYVTNDHGIASGWRRTAEDYLRLRLSRVYVFDGATFKEALAGIGGANGVNVSADGKSLYLSAASERAVHVYDRDPATGALARRATVEVPGFADNIELLANGDLLLGVHSKIFALLASFGDPSKLSPSHVMRLTQDGKGGFAARTVYYNDGEEISALSVAAAHGDRLLMGAIFDPKIVDCAWAGAAR